MNAIEAFLQKHLGIKPEAIGHHVVERGVQARVAELGLDSPIEYLARLDSAIELQELVELLVNRETWFFREAGVFSEIVRLVRKAPKPVLILSLPCSTGEEPYSLAMALLDDGVPAGDFHIEALDISRKSIDMAERARYSKSSFRGSDMSYRDRYFRASGPAWELSGTVRRTVRFVQGNVLSGLGLMQRYHVVVCRNLLIYLTPEATARLFEVLDRSLEADGRLVLSASEANLAPRDRFVSVSSSVFRKKTGEAPISPPPRPMRRPVRAPVVGAAPAPLPSADKELAAVLEMANEGRYEQAATRCQEVVSRFGPSAQAYYLMGLVDGARGRDQAAVDSLRRALYLDPQHEEAQTLLVLHRRKR